MRYYTQNALAMLSDACSPDGQISIFGRPKKSNVETAAFLNGLAITVADYGDIYPKTDTSS